MVTLFILIPTGSAASKIDTVDQFVKESLKELGVPGASYALVHNGEIVLVGSIGISGDKEKITEETPFLIGSLSKSITAFTVMRLVQEGKIELDSPVKNYLPSFTLKDKKVAPEITVRQLIGHTSGMSTATGLKIGEKT